MISWTDGKRTSVEEKAAPILVDEVREAIIRLPCGKYGYDDLPAELIKLDSDVIERVFCKLCNLIVDSGEWPDDWRRLVYVVKLKLRGSPHDCIDYSCQQDLTESIIEANEVRCRRADGRRPNGFSSRRRCRWLWP